MNVGDPITTVGKINGVETPVWHRVTELGMISINVEVAPCMRGRFHATEGAVLRSEEDITWMCGHHDPTSEAWRALLAAWLLIRTET